MPVAAAAQSAYVRARAAGYGDEDFSAVFKVVMEAHLEQQAAADKP
jgi:3-hydroxyisobutyrate dehydrogenase-like beta-hydroxyacid dehydrogenase